MQCSPKVCIAAKRMSQILSLDLRCFVLNVFALQNSNKISIYFIPVFRTIRYIFHDSGYKNLQTLCF